jgi:hypothetical protein
VQDGCIVRIQSFVELDDAMQAARAAH